MQVYLDVGMPWVDREGMDEVAREAGEAVVTQDFCVSCADPLDIEWLSVGSLLKQWIHTDLTEFRKPCGDSGLSMTAFRIKGDICLPTQKCMHSWDWVPFQDILMMGLREYHILRMSQVKPAGLRKCTPRIVELDDDPIKCNPAHVWLGMLVNRLGMPKVLPPSEDSLQLGCT